jgi:hypothetical protein
MAEGSSGKGTGLPVKLVVGYFQVQIQIEPRVLLRCSYTDHIADPFYFEIATEAMADSRA